MSSYSNLKKRIKQDPDFRARFILDPLGVLTEQGIHLSEKKANALLRSMDKLKSLSFDVISNNPSILNSLTSHSDFLGEAPISVLTLLEPDHSLGDVDLKSSLQMSIDDIFALICEVMKELVPREPKGTDFCNYNVVTDKEVKAGDVLLSYGKSCISEAIWYLDKSDYSHAGIFDGKNSVDMHKEGLCVESLNLLNRRQSYVHVYRFISDDGKEMGEKGWSSKPVEKIITTYKEKKPEYNFPQLFMLAVLVILKRVPGDERLKKIIKELLIQLIEVINKYIFPDGEERFVCSGLVYKCFEIARPKGKYRLGILDEAYPELVDMGDSFGDEFPIDLESQSVDELLTILQYRYFIANNIKLTESDEGLRFTEESMAGYVTPGDLQSSSNLKLIGRLS